MLCEGEIVQGDSAKVSVFSLHHLPCTQVAETSELGSERTGTGVSSKSQAVRESKSWWEPASSMALSPVTQRGNGTWRD